MGENSLALVAPFVDVVAVVTIRRIRAGEGEILRRVRLSALADSPSAFSATLEAEEGRSDHEWAERAAAGSDGSLRATFLAIDDQDAIGLVGGYRSTPDSHIVELVSMWTAPEQRRRGTGRALVEAVLAWAVATGANIVELGVTEGNIGALQLYQSCGFRLTGERQSLLGDGSVDELRMRWSTE